MPKVLVPFNSPSMKFAEDVGLSEALMELVNSGPYFHGKNEKILESRIADIAGQKNSIMVSSGTSALSLALSALELESSSEILVAANAGGYASIACIQNRLVPRYVDVDANGQMDFLSLRKSINSNVRAVIVTHLFGQINKNIEAITEFCEAQKLVLIEDCAQAIGAKLESKPAGSFGTLSTFSFYPTKNVGTVGDAGAVATSDPIIFERLVSLREYGWSTRYQIVTPGGSNFRSDEIHALVINRQLEHLAVKSEVRKKIWIRYKNAIFTAGISLLGSEDESFVAHLAVFKTKTRAHFIDHLAQRGIETSIHYPIPDHQQSVFSVFDLGGLATTEALSSQIVSLPLFPEMTENQILLVTESIVSYQKISDESTE
jgi:dTDP-4-amino-4,6-dideoxygalactose transaminase